MFFNDLTFFVSNFETNKQTKKESEKPILCQNKSSKLKTGKAQQERLEKSIRPISMSQLNTSLYLHLSPIYLLV